MSMLQVTVDDFVRMAEEVDEASLAEEVRRTASEHYCPHHGSAWPMVGASQDEGCLRFSVVCGACWPCLHGFTLTRKAVGG